ncbi:MAG: DUF58 domain-containing protein [Planctomycetota bacterium]
MSSNTAPFAFGNAFRLEPLATPHRGPAGQQFGKGSGSSLEFQEFRDYQAGDDLRHVDWRAYARTRTLTTRLYREEIASTVELLVDGSRSMALSPAKEQTTRDLASFLAGAVQGESVLRSVLATDPPLPLPTDALRQAKEVDLPFTGNAPLDALPLATLLRAGTIRILLSDFLFPCDASAFLKKIGARASSLILLQVLDPEEWEPTSTGALRMEDVETESWRDLTVDANTIRRYRQRLTRHCDALEAETRRIGGHYLRILAGRPLTETVMQTLVPSGLVAPR